MGCGPERQPHRMKTPAETTCSKKKHGVLKNELKKNFSYGILEVG